MAKDATKKAADEARDMLLGDRIPAIEKLAAAQAEITKIDEQIERERTARTEAVEAARQRYEEAQKVGWSTRELRRLGFTAPRNPGTRRARATTNTASQQATASESGGSATDSTTTPATDAPTTTDARQERDAS